MREVSPKATPRVQMWGGMSPQTQHHLSARELRSAAEAQVSQPTPRLPARELMKPPPDVQALPTPRQMKSAPEMSPQTGVRKREISPRPTPVVHTRDISPRATVGATAPAEKVAVATRRSDTAPPLYLSARAERALAELKRASGQIRHASPRREDRDERACERRVAADERPPRRDRPLPGECASAGLTITAPHGPATKDRESERVVLADRPEKRQSPLHEPTLPSLGTASAAMAALRRASTGEQSPRLRGQSPKTRKSEVLSVREPEGPSSPRLSAGASSPKPELDFRNAAIQKLLRQRRASQEACGTPPGDAKSLGAAGASVLRH